MRYSLALLPLGLAPFAAAHCKVTGAVGDQGGSTTGLGITQGSGNSESDVTIFQRSATASGIGKTTKGGQTNIDEAIPQAMKLAGSSTPPQCSSGGMLTINMHVVNADGSGPMKCYMSTDTQGSNWQQLDVQNNVPGTFGLSGANNKDVTMQVQMPADATCTGSAGNMTDLCLVKCQNPIGPFGGAVPVQMVSGNSTSSKVASSSGSTGSTSGSSDAGSSAMAIGNAVTGGKAAGEGPDPSAADKVNGLTGSLTGGGGAGGLGGLLGGGGAGGKGSGGAGGALGGLLGRDAEDSSSSPAPESDSTSGLNVTELLQHLSEANASRKRSVGNAAGARRALQS